MIIQDRLDGSLRCFAQHDHALLSGELAHAWCGFNDPPERLPMTAVMAIAMHDFAWHGPDLWETTPPLFDTEKGRPHDFISIPLDERIRIYSDGITALAPIHPYITYLVSRHYASFIRGGVAPDFSNRESARMASLSERLSLDEALATHHFRLLQFFDLLSLYLCMAGPNARPESFPVWLTPQMKAAGVAVTVRWRDAHVVVVEPFPFVNPLTLSIHYRDVPGPRYANVASFMTARSEKRTLNIEVVPAS